jgi:hypothetical protein
VHGNCSANEGLSFHGGAEAPNPLVPSSCSRPSPTVPRIHLHTKLGVGHMTAVVEEMLRRDSTGSEQPQRPRNHLGGYLDLGLVMPRYLGAEMCNMCMPVTIQMWCEQSLFLLHKKHT